MDPDRARMEDSLTALEPMGPHPEDYHRVEREQAEVVARRMKGILGNEPGIEGTYHSGVEKDAHRWALYALLQARVGRDVAGNVLRGDDRLAVLNRGLGGLQPVLAHLDAEVRQELADLASDLKREIGRELGEAVKDDPQALADADAITAGAGNNPGAIVTSLTDVISRGKAVTAAAKPGVELLETELAMGDVVLGKVQIPGPEGTEEFDFAGVRSMDNLVRAVDLLEGYLKLQELSGKRGEPADGAGQAAQVIELTKVTGQVAKGVIEVSAMFARGVARMKGATDIVQHLDGFLKMTGEVGKIFSAADALGGVFVLLSSTSSDMEKADAVKNILVFATEAAEFAAGRAAGTTIANATLANTVAMAAHWGGPISVSIALTWEMLKWIGAETHEFHVTFSHFMMGHAFRALAHHGKEIGKHASKLGALARAMDEEPDPDVRQGLHDEWIEETAHLAAEVQAVISVTAPQADYLSPGGYWTIQKRFADLRANHDGVAKGDAAVTASIECLAAIKDVLTNADAYVALESDRDGDRDSLPGAE